MRLYSNGIFSYKNQMRSRSCGSRGLGMAIFGSLVAAGLTMQTGSANATMIVPVAAGNYTSTNWSGYADVADSGYTFTSVSGQWTVPTVQLPIGSSSAYSAFWVGLDGFSSSSVEQTGVEAQITDGRASYYAWYEMYPAAETEITSINVSAGDTITASVSYSAGNFTLAIDDTTSGKSYSISLAGSDDRSSAEWIAEAPTLVTRRGGEKLLTLADFGSVSFSSAATSLENASGDIKTGSINEISSAAIDSIQMVTSSGQLEANPLSLENSGSAFAITYVPEPATLALLALGLLVFPLVKRFGRRADARGHQ